MEWERTKRTKMTKRKRTERTKREPGGKGKRYRAGATAFQTAGVTITVNLILMLFKGAAGVIGHSDAMLSDAVHSASDVFSTVIVMAGVAAAGKKSDREHPYGHDRMECVAAILLAAALFATGIGIGINGILKVAQVRGGALETPGAAALSAAVISILIKEWMYWYTRAAAKRLHSPALMADAWHHRSDALSSVGALAGIAGARMGFLFLDPAAGVIISVFISAAAVRVFRDAVNKMIDKSCDEATISEISRVILKNEGVRRIDEIRTRMFGAKFYVDIEIAADEFLLLKEAHEIAEEVHLSVERAFPEVKHCMVHVNPYGSGPYTGMGKG